MLALAAILGRVTQPRAHCRYASRPSEGAGEVTGGHRSPGPLGWPPLEVQEVCERNAAPLGCPLLGPQYRPFPGGPTPARTWSPGSLRSSGPGRSVRVNYHPSLPALHALTPLPGLLTRAHCSCHLQPPRRPGLAGRGPSPGRSPNLSSRLPSAASTAAPSIPGCCSDCTEETDPRAPTTDSQRAQWEQVPSTRPLPRAPGVRVRSSSGRLRLDIRPASPTQHVRDPHALSNSAEPFPTPHTHTSVLVHSYACP